MIGTNLWGTPKHHSELEVDQLTSRPINWARLSHFDRIGGLIVNLKTK